jgi:monofunctional glycosyltransferase
MRLALRIVAILLIAWIVPTASAVVALRWLDPPASAVMLMQPGGFSAVQYRWTDRTGISQHAPRAVIAAEDQRFLEHNGFDVVSISQAIADYRQGARLRGASTISQQVAKNLFLWSDRSYVRKALEGYFTLLIEICWQKERIVEVYLNIAELGPGVFGVGAASESYFGKSAAELTAAEAALLAAVLPNPRRLRVENPSEHVRDRQAWILGQMGTLERIGAYRPLRW